MRMLFTLAALALTALGTQAQDVFPSRPLKIVVPTSPGSGSDTTARFFGEQLAAALGQSVLIENKPGANGVIAAMAVKQAPADGYTLFLGTNTHMAVNPVVVKDLPYDAVKDFKFVGGLARGAMMFVAPVNSKYKSVTELVAAAKAAPNKLSVGSYTAGFQLSAEWFASVSGTQHVYVPYKGAPEVYTALLGDQLDWAVTDLIAALPQVKGGKLKALAVSGDKRYHEVPDVPTVKELGHENFIVRLWYGVLAPAATPAPIITRLNSEMHKALASSDLRQRLATGGIEPLVNTPQEFASFIQAETQRYAKVIKSAGIKAE